MNPLVVVLNLAQRPDGKDKPKQANSQIGLSPGMPLNQNYLLLHDGTLQISHARAFNISQVALEMVM